MEFLLQCACFSTNPVKGESGTSLLYISMMWFTVHVNCIKDASNNSDNSFPLVWTLQSSFQLISSTSVFWPTLEVEPGFVWFIELRFRSIIAKCPTSFVKDFSSEVTNQNVGQLRNTATPDVQFQSGNLHRGTNRSSQPGSLKSEIFEICAWGILFANRSALNVANKTLPNVWTLHESVELLNRQLTVATIDATLFELVVCCMKKS